MTVWDADLQAIQEARDHVNAAHAAYLELKHFSQEQVDRVIDAIAEATLLRAETLAQMAVEETGFGNVPDKTLKNKFSSLLVYRYIRPLKTVGFISENKDKKIKEIAVPMGVVAAIIPSTNPTSTAIYKALISLKARNSVVMSPHPNASRCILETCRIMQEAAESAGAPKDSIRCLTLSTLKATQELWGHKNTAVILATGGTAMVRAAYSSGKPAYGVGPGNVPAYIDRTANIDKAVRDVIAGKSFDWGTLCSSEQSMLVDAAVREDVITALKKHNAYLCTENEKKLIEIKLVQPGGGINSDLVGKSPQVIAEYCGFKVSDSVKALVVFLEQVGRNEPLSCEKLSPVLGFYTVNDWQSGCELAIRILGYGGIWHTMSLHARDEKIIEAFGLEKPAFRIIVNSPATLGAVGLTTGIPPAMTLGPGTWGGSITSDNITPMHLLHIKRLAWETTSIDDIHKLFERTGNLPANSDEPAEQAKKEPEEPEMIDEKEIEKIVNTFMAERKSR